MAQETTATHKTKSSAGRRAELLAARIEEGAAGLAAFAEGLSEAEWNTPVSSNRPSHRRRDRAPCCERVPDRS